MKSFALVAALAGTANAFAPASSAVPSTSLQMSSIPDGYEDLVGVDVETGKKFFDPWGLAQWMPAQWAREAELANGRSAMLATVGWFAPAAFGMFDSTDVTTTDPIDAILQADPQWWAQFVILCGVFESYKYKAALEGKSYTGNGEPVVDYLKGYPKDEAARRRMELRELKNGRLAMIGVASFVSAHFIPGSVPVLGTPFH